MSVKSAIRKMYVIQCDRCHLRDMIDANSFDIDTADNSFVGLAWKIIDGKSYCQSCVNTIRILKRKTVVEVKGQL